MGDHYQKLVAREARLIELIQNKEKLIKQFQSEQRRLQIELAAIQLQIEAENYTSGHQS